MEPAVHDPSEQRTVALYQVAFAYRLDATHTDGDLAVLEVEIPPKTLVKPHRVPHAMWNVTDEPARILEIVRPAGLERYFEEIAPVLGEHGPGWSERFYALAQQYGLTILDDWSNELKARYGITL